MSLLSKLEDVRKVKQDYLVLQHRFYGELSARYPYLMNKNIAKLTTKLEEELHLLLCCSLRHNSIRIPLRAKELGKPGGFTIVNVQRAEPGFYYPMSRRGYTDIEYLNPGYYLDDNNDLFQKFIDRDYRTDKETKEDVLLVQLSELKNLGKRIFPDKIDAYFKILREVMSYRPKFLCYTDVLRNLSMGATFTINELELSITERSVAIKIVGSKDKGREPVGENEYDHYPNTDVYVHGRIHYKYNKNEDDLYRLLDYGNRDFDYPIHHRLKLFINNYPEIDRRLLVEEDRKKKAYETCKSFLNQIAVHTVPFKVLGQLTAKK